MLIAIMIFSYSSCVDSDDESPTDATPKPSSTSDSANNQGDKATSSNSSSNSNASSESEENMPSIKDGYITIGGDKHYRVIYETGYLSSANKLLGYLNNFDKESTYTASSDTVIDDGSPEILIGLTNREASTTAMSNLSTYLDFSIIVADNKIAIYASTQSRIDEAIEYFASVLTFDKNGMLAYPTSEPYLEVYKSYPYANLRIAGVDINKFSIVIPLNATAKEKSVADTLSCWIAENSGYKPSITFDSVASKEYEIIIGNAERDECAEYASYDSQGIICSAFIKNKRLMIYSTVSGSYNLAINAFINNIEYAKGDLSTLDVKYKKADEEQGGEQENPTPTPDPTPTPTPDPTPKKAIFIGNSFIYWGGCVTFITNDDANESIRASGGDKGYFNEICKANGWSVDVYNYTYGGQNLEWIYKNKLKNKSSEFFNSFDYVFISEAGQNKSDFVSTVTKVANLFKNAEEIVYLAHEYTFSQNATYIINSLDDLASRGYKIVAWGELVNDVYSGKVSVPNATLSYNKNTFIKNASTSEKMNSNAAVISISGYGDSFHQNPLSGYITAQMCFSAISGESAVGQKYDFCWDKTIAPQYDLQNFLTYQYGKNQTSNFIEVFNSPSDMLGIQKLMDEYMAKYNK